MSRHITKDSVGKGGTKSYVFPLDATSSPSTGLHISTSIGGAPAHMLQVDTGSVGIVIAKRYLHGAKVTHTDKQFELIYSSSGNKYWGHWILTHVTFAMGGVEAKTQEMYVRVVTKFERGSDGYVFHKEEDIDVSMLGVGFDRDAGPGTKDAGGHIVPDHINPFLLIEGMQNHGDIVPGYILSPKSITLGITHENAEHFELVKLHKEYPELGNGEHDTHAKKDWSAPTVSVEVPTSKVLFNATLLVDTGLGYSVVQAPLGVAPRMGAVLVLDDAQMGATARVQVHRNEEVVLRKEGLSRPLYSFTVGAKGDQAPEYVSWRHDAKIHNGKGFINASMHGLSEFDYLFEERHGYLGFRFRLKN